MRPVHTCKSCVGPVNPSNPWPVPIETHTCSHGCGFLWVQVGVGSQQPRGDLCQSLPVATNVHSWQISYALQSQAVTGQMMTWRHTTCILSLQTHKNSLTSPLSRYSCQSHHSWQSWSLWWQSTPWNLQIFLSSWLAPSPGNAIRPQALERIVDNFWASSWSD